jgi:CheY-like chemotaxis protein
MIAPKTRIVVVEDERIVALHLQQRLLKLGYDIAAVATSGDKALELITELRPDVVLMDIHIEGKMDGIETAKRIPPNLHIPIIYLTAYSEEATLTRAKETKPYGYLLKPFSEREMHAMIQMVLERRRADVALQESEQRLEMLVAERTAELTDANQVLAAEMAKRRDAEGAAWPTISTTS